MPVSPYGPSSQSVVTETWRIERVFHDGRRELVQLAGGAWEGTEVQARERARVMQADEPDVSFDVLAVVKTQLVRGRPE